ncbi:uncharacterized protein LOC141663916 [Apium graveolens]|uniref:uncharacterized protein LOC141663916 n=1 Tax=Apium graveolens TaxID=4045 RepID=UPI003D7B9036
MVTLLFCLKLVRTVADIHSKLKIRKVCNPEPVLYKEIQKIYLASKLNGQKMRLWLMSPERLECTGKGNDQVRFELIFFALHPELSVAAPWKKWDIQGREDAVENMLRNVMCPSQ